MILVASFILLSLIRLFYSVGLFRSIGFNEVIIKPTNEGVSIIVCAKNEFDNLQVLIPLLLSQSYQNKEIIIVDDHSTDDTESLIKLYKSIRWITPENDLPGKKNALSQGILSSNNEWILLTDADCTPTVDWATSMMKNKQDNDIVLGYGPMIKSKGIVNLFSRYETLLTALQYLSYAIKSKPYMGVGRNLLYRKSIFEKIGGFASHKDLLSGDDDLFIQSALEHAKIGVCLDPKSFTYSTSKSTWKDFLQQKLRHISTSIKYDTFNQIRLAIFAGSHIFWTLILSYAILSGDSWQEVFYVVSAYYAVSVLTLYRSINRLNEKTILFLYPVLDLMVGFYYIIIGLLSVLPKTSKNQSW